MRENKPSTIRYSWLCLQLYGVSLRKGFVHLLLPLVSYKPISLLPLLYIYIFCPIFYYYMKITMECVFHFLHLSTSLSSYFQFSLFIFLRKYDRNWTTEEPTSSKAVVDYSRSQDRGTLVSHRSFGLRWYRDKVEGPGRMCTVSLNDAVSGQRPTAVTKGNVSRRNM